MTPIRSKLPTLFGAGLVVGGAVVYVDNLAFEGEVSPIVTVAMLLAATAIAGAVWGRRGWIAVAIIWACVPLAHVVKHVLGLPDTLHPNTYMSILFLAAFTLVVAVVGGGCGAFVHKLAIGPLRREQENA
jgi:ATP/ADP translocase